MLEIGGFTPLTTIDFPGRLAAVVFCQGCPWRCRYCQNAHLIPPSAGTPVAWEDIVRFLERRQGLLDGVVFSGGEPTRQAGLAGALRQVRGLGLATALHTAGPYPERLAAVLPLLDWVGIDIKAPASGYAALTAGGESSGQKAWESLRRVQASGVAYEVRTTVHPELLAPADLLALAQELAAAGVTDYALQECVGGHCLDPTLSKAPRLAEAAWEGLQRLFPRFVVRRTC